MERQSLGRVIVNGEAMPWFAGVKAGGFVFLSGTAGDTEDDGRPVDDIERQTELSLDRAAAALERAGSSFEKVVRFNQFIASTGLRGRYLAARERWLSANFPALAQEPAFASTLLVAQFAHEGMLVEIEITATCE